MRTWTPLILMAVLAACGLLDSEPKTLRQAYERQGSTPLPPLLGNRVDVVLGGPTAGTPLKTDATEAAPQIDPAELDRYLRRFAREIDEPHVAVFGILDDETGLYTYRYARVTFDKVGARTMVHLIPDPDDPTLIRGIAAALVPDDPESMSQWTEFLMPQGEHEALGKAAVDQACNWETVVVTPGAYVRVGNGRWKYFPPVTERRCSNQCKSLDSASCSPPWREPFPLPPPPPFPEGDPVGPIETIKPVKPCKGDPLPVMKIRPTAPGKSLESGRHRPCVGQNCAPGTKAVRVGGTKPHHGIDLECALGDPIYAPFSGYFSSGGWQIDRRNVGYGRHIQFVSTDDNGEKFYWGFSHLEDARYFREGFVTAGQIIGYCGRTGYTEGGIHTHMEMGRGPVFASPSRSQLVDPETRLTTTFNSTTGTPTTPTNCRR